MLTYAQLEETIKAHSGPHSGFYLMNLFATIVASYGLLEGSTAVVIGAMVIAVLLGPIAGIGLSLVSTDKELFWRSLLTLVTGSLEVFVVAFLIGLIHHNVPLNAEIISRTQPGLFDLLVAFVGGAAGAYATAKRTPGGTLIGVAIATALVPPLAVAAITCSHGQWHMCRHALLLFLINLIAIQCAYSLVLYLLHFNEGSGKVKSVGQMLQRMAPSLLLLASLGVVLAFYLERRLKEVNEHARLDAGLRAALSQVLGTSLGDFSSVHSASGYEVLAAVRTAFVIGPNLVKNLERSLTHSIGTPVRLTVRSILMSVATRDGYLFRQQDLNVAIDQPQELPSNVAADSVQLRDTLVSPSLTPPDSVIKQTVAFDSLADSIRLADSVAAVSPKRHRKSKHRSLSKPKAGTHS
jgi:uncharacterized hydrophobic protein (TIGR00271 family)